MMNESLTPRRVPPEGALTTAAEGSYLDWPAILAGGVLALALSFLLIGFGGSLGLSLASPYRGEGVSAAWLAIAAGIWFAWVMVTGFGAGGYLAGRMRRRAGDATADEVEARDGAHGLVVWATGALFGAALAATGVGGLIGAGVSVAGSAADTATEAAGGMADSDYFANLMLRRGVTAPQTDTENGVTAAPPAEGQTPAAPATTTAPGTGTEAIRGVDPAVQQEVTGILVRSAVNGEVAERDRSYLAQLVAVNTDLDAGAARARVDEVTAEIDNARATALEAVEDARVAAVVFGFIAAATLLIGAIAAFFAATAGGRHRDAGLGLAFGTVRR